MKRLILVLAVCVSAYGQQINSDIWPTQTGIQAGHSNQRFDGWFRHLHCVDINGVPCPPSSSGGGSGGLVGPGTINRIAKFTAVNNVGDSTGTDDGVGLVQWPIGLSSDGSAYGHIYPNSANGTTANMLACIDPSSTLVAEVYTCLVSTTKAVGVVHALTAGTTGNAQVTTLGFDACIFDNQTVVGDYVGPSTSVAGECSDIGATRPASTQGIGRVTTLNTGAATSAIIDLGPWDLFAPGSTGAGQCSSNNANAYFTGGNLVCDSLVTDDGSGNLTAKSIGLTDSTQAGFFYLKQGTLPTATPANTRMDTLPASVTAHTVVHPAAACAVGEAEIVDTQGTDTSGNTIDYMKCGTAGGGGVEAQTNGVDNANCVATVCPLVNLADGTGTTVTNPSGGVWKVNVAAAPQISTPTAPTLTTNGSAGAVSYTYKVVGCQDGPTCAYHTAASAATTIATGNATLTSSNSINIKAYADTLYGPRCYNVYRTASAGTPSSTGLIAACAWKQVIDTGLAGDSSTAPTTNTTTLDANGLTDPTNPCNKPWAAPFGIDGLPCTPKALDDEFTSTFGSPADINNPLWIWVNQNSSTDTLTGGMVSLSSASRGGANLNCIVEVAPSTPYTFVMLMYPNPVSSTTENHLPGIAMYESGTGKAKVFGTQNNGTTFRWVLTNWTNTTTQSTFPVNNGTGYSPEYLKIQNTGTNVIFSQSPDGIVYTLAQSEAKATFFTTGPDRVGFCIDNETGANSIDIDYWRETQ